MDETRLLRLAAHVLVSEEVDEAAELSVLLVGSDHIGRLNARFAGNDYPTDVLSFPMMEDEDSAVLLGDVVICPEIAAVNAVKAGHDLGAELDTLLVHGTLHLLGYDHDEEEEKRRMNERQGQILAAFHPSVS